MNIGKSLKLAAVAFSSAMLMCAVSAVSASAEETTEVAAETSVSDDAAAATVTSTVSTADTTSSSAVSTTTTTTASSEEKKEDVETEWYKAELDDYDDSLSLISYEVSPESAKAGESTAKSKKNSKNDSKKATPVELNVTGGYVGDIPWFESEPVIENNPGQFAIVTYGWGHGVGMSQNGANFYAQYSGWTYQDILFHYYPDTYLMNTGTAEDEEITVAGVSGDVLSMVSQIVYNEVGGSMDYEAIKAQAVAVYTYCKYNGNDSSDLRCKPYPPQVVVDACAEVLGQALYYDGDFALTMFSASSGGITANCNEVFWADLPYLRSVSSDYDAAYDPHYGTVTYIDDFQLRNMIQSAYGIKLSDDPSQWIQPEYSDSTGYVTYVNIDNQKTVRGYDFKLAMDLKSSKFNIFYTPRPDGEPIPNGTSKPRVVDNDYIPTPGILYENNQPTDIGAPKQTTTTEPATEEETTETTAAVSAEPSTNGQTEPITTTAPVSETPTWQQETTTAWTTEPWSDEPYSWTEPTTSSWTEAVSSDDNTSYSYTYAEDDN